MVDIEYESPRSMYMHPSAVKVDPDVLKQLTTKAKAVIDADFQDWRNTHAIAELPHCLKRSFLQWLLGKPKPTAQEAWDKAEAIVDEKAPFTYRNVRYQRLMERLHNLAHNVDFAGAHRLSRYDYADIVEIAAGNIHK